MQGVFNLNITHSKLSIFAMAAALSLSPLISPLLAPAGAEPRPEPRPVLQAEKGGTEDQAQVISKLNKSQFSKVKVSFENSVIVLAGTVDLFQYKADAARRVHKVKGFTEVHNLIQVAGPTVSDQELRQKLSVKITYDRVGYGNVFDAITLSVNNGAVTLGGHARYNMDKDSAIALVSNYPGVKEVTSEIEVDPASIMDDRIRFAVARAIYGYPSLRRYSLDPAKPIRISVQNGRVQLYGTVDSPLDKETVYLRANSVPGIFSVKSYVQVASQHDESKK